ncbi:hypothetical protein A2389_01175 [Candidatus Adlerbacteria bacterium RIFOXYB1_FULL_48_10]|nr:MAG: hypothetical protein A2389_01175 [Candidatus Adlerbacteria bacterium RIFOXYB1_FULL_48_10]
MVIAIIGVLASVVLANLTAAREKSRDAKRLSDIRQIQIALDLYYDDNNRFPTNPASYVVANMNTGTTDITPYINPIPADPTNTGSNGYRYRAPAGYQSYTILVNLEKNSTWCSASRGDAASGVMPGYSAWNYSNGTTYPPCR